MTCDDTAVAVADRVAHHHGQGHPLDQLDRLHLHADQLPAIAPNILHKLVTSENTEGNNQ